MNTNTEFKTSQAKRRAMKKYYDNNNVEILRQKKQYNTINKNNKTEYDRLHYEKIKHLRKEAYQLKKAIKQ